jgi:hypothetical protein
MRQRLVQVLRNDEDEAMTEIVLRFWTRAKPLAVGPKHGRGAPVVDLAQWIESRRGVSR